MKMWIWMKKKGKRKRISLRMCNKTERVENEWNDENVINSPHFVTLKSICTQYRHLHAWVTMGNYPGLWRNWERWEKSKGMSNFDVCFQLQNFPCSTQRQCCGFVSLTIFFFTVSVCYCKCTPSTPSLNNSWEKCTRVVFLKIYFDRYSCIKAQLNWIMSCKLTSVH